MKLAENWPARMMRIEREMRLDIFILSCFVLSTSLAIAEKAAIHISVCYR